MTTEFFEKYRHKIKTTGELLEIIGSFPRKKTAIVYHGLGGLCGGRDHHGPRNQESYPSP